MSRLLSALALALAAALLAAAPASAGFGLKDLDVTFTEAPPPGAEAGELGATLSQAGAHPFALTVDLAANTRPEPALPEIGEVPDGEVRDLHVVQIPGLAGNPRAVPTCPVLEFLGGETGCPVATRLGSAQVTAGAPFETLPVTPIFNLDPPPGSVAKFGFWVLGVPVTVEASIEPTPPYSILATTDNVTNVVNFYAAHTVFWGVPAAAEHDAERAGAVEAGVPPVPFLTTPRACEGPLPTTFRALSWNGESFEHSLLTHDDAEPPQPVGFTGCEKLVFAPRASVAPTTTQASSPSGLDFELNIEDEGLANPTGIAASDIKKGTLKLPEGMTLNPSTAAGLAACSPADFEREAVDTAPGGGCPQASKVGTVEVETPLLKDELLKGSLYVAEQGNNPFGSLLALYMVIRDPQLGILVKLAGRVSPDPVSGQIITSFGEPGQELPQFPLSRVAVRLREGATSPLITPPGCGPYNAEAVLTPWADPAHPLSVSAGFRVSAGPGGGPCPPAGTPPFKPGFEAGTLNNHAKSHSPFLMRLTRRDGDQDMTRFAATLPPGVVGTIAGLGRCGEAQIAAARTRSGRAEQASPSCPADSLIGTTEAGAGVGSQLIYVPGRLYLAPPYKGSPLSVVSITPAVAGPFDVGTVVVREGLALDPVTLQVKAEGSSSDPIPHILEGIVLKVRDLQLDVGRPGFISNPTDCSPFATKATLFGSGPDVFDPADDVGVALSDRFRAAGCARLGFKPRLSFNLLGGTRRGAHPALRTVVRPRPEDANFSSAVVTLPRSAFLEQAHIRTVCTRVQFAAPPGNGAHCPAGAVYGQARAYSPLIDGPATGPVYLRSSNHKLPDLVVALKGPPSAQVDAELVGRIDSHKGGIRASFETIPDLPVSRFVLAMQGGRKGLIVNSRNLCAHRSRAILRLLGQNDRPHNARALFRPAGCAKHKRHSARHHRR